MAVAETTLPLVSEELAIDTRSRPTGRVRVETKTELVEEIASAELESSEIEVLRVPVNRQVEKAPAIRTEGDVTIVPVLEEVLVVEKRLVLKEELHVRRRTTVESVETPVTLRKQRAIVSRQPGDTPTQRGT